MSLETFDVEEFCKSRYGKETNICQKSNRFVINNTIFQINDIVFTAINCKEDKQNIRFDLPIQIKEVKVINEKEVKYKGKIFDASKLINNNFCKKNVNDLITFTNKNIFDSF